MRPNDGRVVSNFINQGLRGEPITVYGDGTQTRSFCYVDDLVDGIFRLLMSDEPEPTNVGNPNETTIGQFAEEVAELLGIEGNVVYEPLPADDPKVRQPDITKARAVLGWEPKVDRKEGLRRTVEYFKDRVSGSRVIG
jgi:dTDP-glucose 4,6-dehydratase